MHEQEARLILQAYRPGGQDQNDPHFAEALQETVRNSELGRWFAEEQAFDQAIAGHLEKMPAPFGLKTRILANDGTPTKSWAARWTIGLAAIAALLFLLAQVVGLWRNQTPAAGALPDYSREMVSFIQRPPPLDMESQDLGKIQNWLAQKKKISAEVPPALASLEPVGCRILSFRGHDVTLICFHRDGNRLAHLFVVDRAALPKLKPGEKPVFSTEGEWTTASWAEKDHAYMITVQGDRDAAQAVFARRLTNSRGLLTRAFPGSTESRPTKNDPPVGRDSVEPGVDPAASLTLPRSP